MKKKHTSHSWLIGLIGLAFSVAMFILFPYFNALNGILFFIAIFHLIAAIIMLISLYTLTPKKVKSKLISKKLRDDTSQQLYFGWTFGWMNGYWIVGIAL